MSAPPRFKPAPAAEAAAEWAPPVLFDAGPNLPDIPMGDILPGVVGAYARATAAELQVPEAMPGLLILTVIATGIQRQRGIRPRIAGAYYEPVSWWSWIFMPSANRKSETKARVVRPLNRWEAMADRKLRPAIERMADNAVVAEKKIARLRNLLAECDHPDETARLSRELDDLRKVEPVKLARPKLSTADATPEQTENLLQEHGGKMAIISDEGGTFATWAGLYSGGESRLDAALQGHTGGDVRVDRASRVVCVTRAALSMGLTAQPELLHEMPENARRKFRYSGLIARAAVAFPPSQVGRRNVRLHAATDPTLREAYDQTILGLLETPEEILERAANPPETDEPILFTLDAEALEAWLQFQERLEPRMVDGGDLDGMRDWGGKAPGMVLRAAALIHAVGVGLHELTVGVDAVTRAVRLVEALEPHARALMEGLGADQAAADARRLFGHIQREARAGKASLTKTDLNRASKGQISGARLDRAIQALQDRAILGAAVSEPTDGRTRMLLPINPHLAGA